jgi:hypothetical protein
MPDVLTPKAPRAGGFPKVPAPPPPCVLRSPALFSARSQHTQRPDSAWWFCRPIGAFQRPSSQRLLHYWSPSGFHFCCRSVPSGCVQRTGCSACGLGYPAHPTPGLVGSPHVHVLGPVPGVDVMAKRSQGWVKCEDRLPYYRDSSCSLPPLATTPRPQLHDSRGPRGGGGGGAGGKGPARVGRLGLQCSARALFRTASFK